LPSQFTNAFVLRTSLRAIYLLFLGTTGERKVLAFGPDSEARKDALKKFIGRCAILSVLLLIENVLLLY
jgi:hypothetical protein